MDHVSPALASITSESRWDATMPYSRYAAPLLQTLARRMQSRLGCKVDTHRLARDAVYASAINEIGRAHV